MLTKLQKLKIAIICNGIQISPIAKQELTEKGKVPLSVFEYPTTSGISVILPDNIYVNAQFSGKFINSNIKVDFQDGQYYITHNGDKYSIKILSLPDYIGRRDRDGSRYDDIIMTHTDRMRISPIMGCSFDCKYCDWNKMKYKKTPLSKLKRAVDIALEDENLHPRHMLISGGTPRVEDRDYIDNIYKNITQYLNLKNIPTDIMLAPRSEKNFLRKMKSWGVDGLSINLEIYNSQIAKEYNPAKFKIKRERYFQFIKEAVGLFGAGKVRSILIVGLEPVEETIKGVESIARLGCDVVLSPFVPAETVKLVKLDPPNEATLIDVYEKSSKIVKKYNVKLGPRCIPCQHNTLAFPDEENCCVLK